MYRRKSKTKKYYINAKKAGYKVKTFAKVIILYSI